MIVTLTLISTLTVTSSVTLIVTLIVTSSVSGPVGAAKEGVAVCLVFVTTPRGGGERVKRWAASQQAMDGAGHANQTMTAPQEGAWVVSRQRCHLHREVLQMKPGNAVQRKVWQRKGWQASGWGHHLEQWGPYRRC